MIAQIITIHQNGYAEAHDLSLRNRSTLLSVADQAQLKGLIWSQLQRVGRQGSVLVKWNNKMYLCEMKANKQGYHRTELQWHPHQDRFTI